MIRIQNLRKVYKVGDEKVVALDNISLEIPDGEFCCIIGASGSGKSTLLNQLAGLEKPTRGKISIDGKFISKMNEKELAKFRQTNIGFIFQSYNLMPTMTAVENVAFPLMFSGVDKKTREKRARKVLEQMGLGGRLNHKPGEMSGGQQQRVGIRRAFVGKQKVIFADEPTGNLDSVTTETVMKMLIEKTRKEGITFVMVTHNPDLAKMARRVITLKDGRVIEDTRDGVSLLRQDAEIARADENPKPDEKRAETRTDSAESSENKEKESTENPDAAQTSGEDTHEKDNQ